MAELKISDEQWSSIVGAAVLQTVTPENRDVLIKEAITSLLRPERVGNYGPTTSPLQKAFDWAMQNHATGEINRLLGEDSEIIAQLNAVIRQAITKALADESMSTNMATAIAKVLSGSMRDY